jgi:hypothetical protein
MKVILPLHVKTDAELFADTEAKRGTKAWENAFYRYCHDMYSTSLVPAESNPEGEHDVLKTGFPELFRDFAGRGKNKTNVQRRLMGIIGNITNIILESELGFKIKRDKDADLSNDRELTSFELPAMEGKSKGSKQAIQRQTYYNRHLRLLVTSLVAESLLPLLRLNARDMKAVLARTKLDEIPLVELKSKTSLGKFIEVVRKETDHVFGNIELRNLGLKHQLAKIQAKTDAKAK